jgi:DNA-binding SARP family transcriptional activator
VRIQLLGTVEIHGDATVERLERAREKCVLAVLALSARRPVALTTLVNQLWEPPEQTDNSLQSVRDYVGNVRSAIKKSGGNPDWLRYERGAQFCMLDIDPSRVDYHQFRALAAIARQKHDAEIFRQALELWQAPALADINTLWANNRRDDMEAERLEVHLDLLDLQLTAGQPTEVARAAAEMLDRVIPTDRILILGAQALAGCGRHPAIAAWKQRVIQRMRDAVDAAPSPEALHHVEDLIANPHWTPPPPAQPAARGMFSMRADIATFTGREEETRRLIDAVRAAIEGSVHAIAIHAVDGMPGVGKTAFSVHAAHHLADRFPDGNLFVELHGHSPGQNSVSPAEALQSLLLDAGVDPKAIPRKLDDRARAWRTRMAGKKILLVLDDVTDHHQVRPLIPGSPGSLVLITSRHRLPALDGVQPFTLDVLAPDQAVQMLLRIAELEPHRHDETAVTDIVERCGYLPLAIALAASRLRSHPTRSFGCRRV